MDIKRRRSKIIRIGHVRIGGQNPIAIQSMVKTKTARVQTVVQEIEELGKAGCEIVRLAVKDTQDALSIRRIKRETRLPIVADIHFDWRLALKSVDSGADKIRLNPGNIYKKEELKEVVRALKLANVPLRIGVNSGSVRAHNNKRLSVADKLVASCLESVRTIEKMGFTDLVLSLKASHVLDTVEAYRKIARFCDYPLHLGVTASGLPLQGAIKSSMAVGRLLMEGIGDTIRISLTAEPLEEVQVARIILESLGLRRFMPEIISCPTCGRCEVDLVGVVKNLEKALANRPILQRQDTLSKDTERKRSAGQPMKVAVMGCVVNGPGEAKEADIGVAFGKKEGLLFKNGKPLRKVSYERCVESLLKEMEAWSV
jgi:(E)-4-hydroxy-3-methylbut-2-enyl-diphosphate synthase